MYTKVQNEQIVKYYTDGNWLSHELTNGPIPVPPRMGRILLCLASHQPPADANRHLKVIEDADNVIRYRSVPKTPSRRRIATLPETPSTLMKSMRIDDVNNMVQAGTLFEMEKTDDGESFWINSAPSQIRATPSPKKTESTNATPKKHPRWPEMTEDMDDLMRPLHKYLVAADALRKAQELHGDWVTPSKFYDIWWKYRVCHRKGLIDRYYGETFKTAAKEITSEDIDYEKIRLVRTFSLLLLFQS